ncbi:hypothetical protein SAMN05216371_6519 [Streptomyces sp. TLI_053]|uniref:DUF1648 domain-containing protein n=1 Tax=Streptomyces sp. TLI_053 TaxID=1855352 RepID=UPI0008795E64|nr:DUF1648 domain-containing protein [Streptomyces sp. TLI_053]SDT81032.1 hypothetical protein SAMN05216371_6519 [Streptomyces sp. TLI_053]
MTEVSQEKGRDARRDAVARAIGLLASGALVLGVLALLLGLPWMAHGRLPEPVATHWNGTRPDGSMSLTAAAGFPAAVWMASVAAAAVATWRGGEHARGWSAAGLGFGGALLTGAQAAIVSANLDRPTWQEARPLGAEVLLVLVAAVAAGALAWWLARPQGPGPLSATVPDGPRLDLPDGQRAVWLSRAVNPWLGLLAAVTGLGAAGAALAGFAGLGGVAWATAAPLAVAALAGLGCSSVQARVTERGLDVAFGPLGRPSRHWDPEEIAAARAETRTPAQVGGWGYRLNGLGTTVMLRRGECLVIRPRQGAEFAVSVDDAERGAALLNTLAARRGA